MPVDGLERGCALVLIYKVCNIDADRHTRAKRSKHRLARCKRLEIFIADNATHSANNVRVHIGHAAERISHAVHNEPVRVVPRSGALRIRHIVGIIDPEY